MAFNDFLLFTVTVGYIFFTKSINTMSKEYFAKYLPVEGEIKEGDKFIHTELNEKGIYTAINIDANFIDSVRGEGDEFSDPVVPIRYCKKVKLFLCSRDNPDEIIGEVSEDAKWVKEDMEFSQEDIDIYDVQHLPTIVHFKCPHCGTFM